MTWLRWFDEIGMADVASVGGKNASLGEMRQALRPLGINIPDGFATTADGYRDFVRSTGLEPTIRDSLSSLNIEDLDALQRAGARVRSAILAAPLPAGLGQAIRAAYRRLEQQYGLNCDVAVRSSATAEDLPEASFAGQQETFLNIHGEAMLLDAVRRCYASLFTDRAIVYRVHHGFDHPQVALSVGVQKMVRSDLASAGVMFQQRDFGGGIRSSLRRLLHRQQRPDPGDPGCRSRFGARRAPVRRAQRRSHAHDRAGDRRCARG